MNDTQVQFPASVKQCAVADIPIKLSVVVPAYNESRRLGNTLETIWRHCEDSGLTSEILVVDDGSTDDTSDIVERFMRDHKSVRLISYAPNRGKGYAVRIGVLQAQGDLVLFSDADLATPIQEVEKLAQYLANGFDVAVASRAVKGSQLIVRQSAVREMGGRAINVAVRLMAVPGIKDTQCGFKLFRNDVAKAVFSRCVINDFSFDVETLYLASRMGYSITEVPVQWTHMDGSKVRPFRDGLRLIAALIKIRRSHRGALHHQSSAVTHVRQTRKDPIMAIANSNLVRVAVANSRSILAQWLYLRCNVDISRPVQTYVLLTTRCNARCRMCGFWREKPIDELPAEAWVRYLTELRVFAGTPNVNFSGGEPLVRKDLFEILDCCRRLGLPAGITTNGILVNKQNTPKLIDAGLFNINVSLDSLRDEIHDGMRGVPGLLNKLRYNLDSLMDYKETAGSDVRVMLKPVVCAETLSGLEGLVRYAKDLKMTGVSFQPIFDWSEDCKEMSQVDLGMLDETVETLAGMKKEGYPILNSEASIRHWSDYFRGKWPEQRSPCVVALRDLFVYPGGDAIFCGDCNGVIGNIAQNDIRSIWFSAEARKPRRQLVKCKRFCLNTCVVKRSLRDYVSIFLRLSRS